MSILDNKSKIFDIDTKNFYSEIINFAENFQKSFSEAKNFSLPSYFIKAEKIVFCGMGASGMIGDFISLIAKKQSSFPVNVYKSADVPKFIDEKTIVFAISASGNTIETLNFFEKSVKQGAKIIAITQGGQIEKLASKYAAPIYKFNYHSQPRLALGQMFGSVLAILNKLGILETEQNDFDQALIAIKHCINKCGVEAEEKSNPAKKIAEKIHNKNILVWSGDFIFPVALRFSQQINENAKQLAFPNQLSELHHNLINGLNFPIAKNHIVVFIHSKYYSPEIIKRIEISKDLLAKNGIEFISIEAETTGYLAEILYLVLALDLTSYYLAILNNVDPEEIENISYIKSRI